MKTVVGDPNQTELY